MSEIITDNLGRMIAIKKPSTLERINFFRIIGAEDCSNPMILAEFHNAMWVKSIDNNPMPKKQMVDIEYIIEELEKGDADELISSHKISIYNKKKKEEESEADIIKK